MVDIIFIIILLVLLAACGIFAGYNIRKVIESKENRLIGKDDYYMLGSSVIVVSRNAGDDVRAMGRKAYIALCKASEPHSNESVEQIEEYSGRYFDARMRKVDDACGEDEK